MGKYMCKICGYTYDEVKGVREVGVAPGTKWDDMPRDWVCPLCGATKEDFEKQGGLDESKVETVSSIAYEVEEFKELSALEISALCTNLARGCEKQYKLEEAASFNELAEYFKGVQASAEAPSFEQLQALIENDLSESLPRAKTAAADNKDRGALRALTWSDKVSRILKSLLNRYQKEGDAMIENTGVYVCTICGFIYIGDNPPDLCPVCKVPNWKFEKIEGSGD